MKGCLAKKKKHIEGMITENYLALVMAMRQEQCADQIETSTFPLHPGHLFKIGSFKFPPLWAKMMFKGPTLSSHFVCQRVRVRPLLKNSRRRFLWSVIKLVLVYIRGTQRHQFKRESYFRRWLRGTLYALRTRNTY